MWKLLLVTIIILVIFFIYQIINSSQNNYHQRLKTMINYNEIKSRLKTGDIIMFACKKHDNFIIEAIYNLRTSALGIDFGHAGIVIKVNGSTGGNGLYLLEVVNTDHPGNDKAYFFNGGEKGGLRIMPLKFALETYTNECNGIYAVRFADVELSAQCLSDNIYKYTEKTFPSKTSLFLLGFIDIIISHAVSINMMDKISSEEKIMCTEFLYSILNDCDTVKDFPAKLFWPHYLSTSKFDTLSKINYSEPVIFYFNN